MAEDFPDAARDADAEADEAALEAFVDQHVKQALDPYRDQFSAAVLDEWEDDLRCFLLTHPVAYEMLRRIGPHVRATSGPNPAALVAEELATRVRKGKAG